MTIQENDSSTALEDEWYAIRYSGEIPEVAFHSALFHLTEDQDGPRLSLSPAQVARLVDAVRLRYLDIIQRDLLPANRQTSAYRGVKRAMINWKRFALFCGSYDLDISEDKEQVARGLLHFLAREIEDMRRPGHCCSINCSFEELCDFSAQLGLSTTGHLLPLRHHCH
jgi:hypothetical protein